MRGSGREGLKLFAFALAIRLASWLLVFQAAPLLSDAHSYFDVAGELVRGELAQRAHYWPPGMPFLLVPGRLLAFDAMWLASLVTILVSAAVAPLVAYITGLAGADARTCRTAGVLTALYMPAVFLSGQPYSQHLAMLSLLVIVAALLSSGAWTPARGAVLGASLGVGVLTRPSMAVVALVIAGAVILQREAPLRRRLTCLLTAAVVAAALVTPVLAHNARLGAGTVVSTNNERNFFLGNNRFTPDYKTSHLGQRSLAELPTATQEYLASVYAQPEPRQAMVHEALAFIRENPGRTLRRTFNRTLSFWGFDYLSSRLVPQQTKLGKLRSFAVLAGEAGTYLLVMILAIVALVNAEARSRFSPRAQGILIATTLAYALPYSIAFSGGTYHFPVMGLVLPFAAVGATFVWETKSLGSMRRLALPLLALFALQAQYAYHTILMSGS